MNRARRFADIGAPRPSAAAVPTVAAEQSERTRFADLMPVGSAGTATPDSSSGVAAERFRRGRSRESIPLATGEGEQPFVRCVACRADSFKHATECQVCGATFDSDDQRRFNAEIATQLLEDARLVRERRQRRTEEIEQRMQAGIESRQRQAAERERLDGAGAQIAELFRNRRPSLGLVLLRKIRNPFLRMAVILGLLGWFVSLWWSPATGGSATMLAFGIALVFLPRFGRRR